MNAYIFAYNNALGDRAKVKIVLNKIPEIANYRAQLLPNVFFLVSEYSAHDLAIIIKRHFPKECAFLISEIGPNKQGYLDQLEWKIINDKPAVR